MTPPIEEIARGQLVDALIEAARSSTMPAGEQMRFESMLNQMSGRLPRKDPLPALRTHLQSRQP